MSDRLEQLRKLAALDPADPMGHYGVGLELMNLERWADAAAAFAQAIAADAKYSAAYYHKARAEIAAQQPDAARDTLTLGMGVARNHGDWKTANEMQDLLDTLE